VRPSAAAFRVHCCHPRRERDPFLRFALDAEGELCRARRREVEITAGLSHRRRQDVARVDTEAVDQVLPDRLLQPPPLGLAEAGVFASYAPLWDERPDHLKCCLCLVDLVILDHDVVVCEGPCRVWCEGSA